MELQEAVKALRDATGLTQQQLAEELGLSLRAITNYEKDRKPSGVVLARLYQLAADRNQDDLAEFFWHALAHEIGVPESWEGALEPIPRTNLERIWTAALLAVLRNPKRYASRVAPLVRLLADPASQCKLRLEMGNRRAAARKSWEQFKQTAIEHGASELPDGTLHFGPDYKKAESE